MSGCGRRRGGLHQGHLRQEVLWRKYRCDVDNSFGSSSSVPTGVPKGLICDRSIFFHSRDQEFFGVDEPTWH